MLSDYVLTIVQEKESLFLVIKESLNAQVSINEFNAAATRLIDSEVTECSIPLAIQKGKAGSLIFSRETGKFYQLKDRVVLTLPYCLLCEDLALIPRGKADLEAVEYMIRYKTVTDLFYECFFLTHKIRVKETARRPSNNTWIVNQNADVQFVYPIPIESKYVDAWRFESESQFQRASKSSYLCEIRPDFKKPLLSWLKKSRRTASDNEIGLLSIPKETVKTETELAFQQISQQKAEITRLKSELEAQQAEILHLKSELEAQRKIAALVPQLDDKIDHLESELLTVKNQVGKLDIAVKGRDTYIAKMIPCLEKAEANLRRDIIDEILAKHGISS